MTDSVPGWPMWLRRWRRIVGQMDQGEVAYPVQLQEVEGQEGEHEGGGVGDVEVPQAVQ